MVLKQWNLKILILLSILLFQRNSLFWMCEWRNFYHFRIMISFKLIVQFVNTLRQCVYHSLTGLCRPQSSSSSWSTPWPQRRRRGSVWITWLVYHQATPARAPQVRTWIQFSCLCTHVQKCKLLACAGFPAQRTLIWGSFWRWDTFVWIFFGHA